MKGLVFNVVSMELLVLKDCTTSDVITQSGGLGCTSYLLAVETFNGLAPQVDNLSKDDSHPVSEWWF